MADERKYFQYYKEASATLIAERHVPGTNLQVVTRYWPIDLPINELQQVVAELDLWTSAKNTSQRRWVDEPGVNNRANDGAPYSLPGRWRCTENRIARPGIEKQGIYQELAQGYLQPPGTPGASPATWPALDAIARITKVMDYTATGKAAMRPYFVVTYPNVAQETVKAFVEALVPRGTISNPTFDNQAALTGDYKFVAARNDEQEDGSSIVMGILVSATENTGLEVLYANNCGSKVTHYIYMNLTAPPAVTDGSSGVEYNIREYSFDPLLGMYSMVIEKVEQKTLTAGVNTEEETEIEKVEAQDFTGVRTGDLDDAGAAVPLWTPGNPTPGVEYTQQVSKNQNCTTDKRQKKRTVKALPAKVVRRSKTLFDAVVSTQDKASTAAASAPADAAGGVTQETVAEKNGLQQFDNEFTERTELSVSSAEVANQATIFETQSVITDRSQAPTTPLTATATGGVITEKTGKKTPGAMLDVTTTVKTELSVSGAVVANDATIFETRAKTLDRAQDASTPLNATASGGVIVSKKGDKTPGGKLDVSTETVNEVEALAAKVSGVKTAFSVETVETDRNRPLATDISVPAAALGVIVEKESSKTPGGLRDITVVTKTETPVTAATVSTTKTAFDQRASQVDRSQPATTDLTVSAAANGVVTTKTGAVTPGALKDITTETITEIPVTAADVENASTLFDVVAVRTDRSQPLSTSLTPESAAGGVTQTVRGAKTNGLLLDVTKTTKTENQVPGAEISSQATIFNTQTITVDRAQVPSTPLMATATGGVITEKSGRKTPGAMLDVSTNVKVELPVTAAIVTNDATIYETIASQVDRAQPLATALGASAAGGVIVSKKGDKTPGGLLDVSTETKTEIPVSNARVAGVKTAFESEATVVDRSQPISTDLSVPVAASGVVTQKEGVLTPGGLKDVTTNTKTEIPVTAASLSVTKTAFDSRVTQVDRSQAASTSLAVPDAAGGVVVTKTGQVTPGALKDVTTETNTEIPVADAVVDKSATIFATVESKLDRSQPPTTSVDPLPAAGGVSQSVRGSKTNGLLLDVTTNTKTELPVADAVKSQSKTVYEQRDGVIDRAQPAATSLVAPAAEAGVTVTKRGEKTDGGLLDVTTDTTTEQSVADASIQRRATIFATQETVEDKAQPLATSLAASAGGGTIVEKRGVKTPGGLLDVQTDTQVEVPVASARVSGAKTLFSEESSVVDQNQPAATSLTVPAASAGVVTTKSGDKTPGGLLNVTTRTETEKEVDAASVTKRLTAFRLSVDTENRGKATAAADPTAAGQEVSNTRTPGALYNQRTTAQTPVAVALGNAGSSKVITALETTVTQRAANQDAKETEPTSQTAGTVVRVINDLNDLAKWDVEKQTDTATKRSYSYLCVDPTGDTNVTVYRNYTEDEKNAEIAASPIIYRKSMDWQINRFDLFDGHIQTVNSTSFTWGFHLCDHTSIETNIIQRNGQTFLHLYRYTFNQKKGLGVQNGRQGYSGALSGSTFQDLAGDWYEYRKVTKIEFCEKLLAQDVNGVNFWSTVTPYIVLDIT